ncbi:MAG TPA: hypothetical protein VL633_11520 [Bacteroidota bacterium]|jgi:hypothetical protein|nr:hypothetical protein [Bacteroidota bacterium]
MKLKQVIFLCCLALLLVQVAVGQIPRTLSYQGVLADPTGNPKPDGSYNFTFRLYTVASGGGPIWVEAQPLTVKRGLFSAILGSTTPFSGVIDFGKQYWLGIQVSPDPEMMPRIQLSSVGSSFSAIRADVATTVPDTSLTQAKIGSGQVVKSINNLHDQIVFQGANGASVTTTGDTLTITASGGGGGGIGTIQNTDNTLSITNPAGPTATINLKSPLVVPGNFGIGGTPSWPFHLKKSESTGSGLQARVTNTSTTANSFAAFSLESNNGAVVNQIAADGLGSGPLATPSGYLGTYTNHPLGVLTNNVERMRITSGGAVGIGTVNPTVTLDINGGTFGGGTRTFSDGAANFIVETIGGTNSWAKYYVKTASQQWSIGSSQNFNGNQLYFSNESGGAIDMAIMPNGNVGIGTTNPTVKLNVAGSGVLESSLQSIDERAILSLNSTMSGQNRVWTLENGLFGIAGLFGIYDRTAGRAALTINTNGVVKAENNAAQSRDKGGLVKAMVRVSYDGSLIQCYNGVDGVSNCNGFAASIVVTGSDRDFQLDFPFSINDRFLSITASSGDFSPVSVFYTYSIASSNRLFVSVRKSDGSSAQHSDIHVIVY